MSKKTLLLGRKIRGDIGPTGLEPITNQPGRILSPAVSLTGVDQFYDQESATQNFTIGSRMVVDERTFHYSKAALAIPDEGTYYMEVMTDLYLALNEQASAGVANIGDVTVVVTNGGGGFQAGTVTLNELVGGWLAVWAGAHLMWRRITANTAQIAGAPGTITFTVDRPWNFAVPNASLVEIHPSIYRATKWSWDSGLGSYQVAVGIAPVPVPINHYYWLQTYGPCWIGAALLDWPLATANYVDLYFSINEGGSRSSLQANPACGGRIGVAISPQRIGYALGAGQYGPGSMMLQLAP